MMEQPDQQPIEEIKLEVKRMIFNSWKKEIRKGNGITEPIEEEVKIKNRSKPKFYKN